MSTLTRADCPRVALAAVRLMYGTSALVAPKFLARRLGVDPASNGAVIYVFRLFGIRTVLIGLNLLDPNLTLRAEAVNVAVLVHASDTASAVIAGMTGQLPRRAAFTATVISGMNVALAVMAQRAQHPTVE